MGDIPSVGEGISIMPRVLLCGKSLLISGLQSILERAPGLELHLEGSHPERIREHVQFWKPDVLMLETEMLINPMFLSLLQDYPQMKLIGVDIEANRLQVFSGTTSYEPTPEQLLQVIQR